jgi:hypothetical protein
MRVSLASRMCRRAMIPTGEHEVALAPIQRLQGDLEGRKIADIVPTVADQVVVAEAFRGGAEDRLAELTDIGGNLEIPARKHRRAQVDVRGRIRHERVAGGRGSDGGEHLDAGGAEVFEELDPRFWSRASTSRALITGNRLRNIDGETDRAALGVDVRKLFGEWLDANADGRSAKERANSQRQQQDDLAVGGAERHTGRDAEVADEAQRQIRPTAANCETRHRCAVPPALSNRPNLCRPSAGGRFRGRPDRGSRRRTSLYALVTMPRERCSAPSRLRRSSARNSDSVMPRPSPRV